MRERRIKMNRLHRIPAPSSVKDMTSLPWYIESVDRQLSLEKRITDSHSKQIRAARQFRYVVLDSWKGPNFRSHTNIVDVFKKTFTAEEGSISGRFSSMEYSQNNWVRKSKSSLSGYLDTISTSFRLNRDTSMPYQ